MEKNSFAGSLSRNARKRHGSAFYLSMGKIRKKVFIIAPLATCRFFYQKQNLNSAPVGSAILRR